MGITRDVVVAFKALMRSEPDSNQYPHHISLNVFRMLLSPFGNNVVPAAVVVVVVVANQCVFLLEVILLPGSVLSKLARKQHISTVETDETSLVPLKILYPVFHSLGERGTKPLSETPLIHFEPVKRELRQPGCKDVDAGGVKLCSSGYAGNPFGIE